MRARIWLMECCAVVVWVREHADMYSAEIVADQCCKLHLLVEGLGDTGWDWHVWDTTGRLQQRYGLADTAAQAKAQAEAALGLMIEELNCRCAS